MRVRTGGSHHQKLVVIRHRGHPERDIAYVGGIDLCHSRRDDAEHLGDPQALEMAPEYGDTPPWHDVMAAISGPAVHDVETVFRERWEDPTRLTRHPVYWTQDKLLRMDMTPDPLPEQAPPPPSPEGATHVVQLLRTYPEPAPRSRLPVRPGWRAQRRPRLQQGRDAGPEADLHRGPVPLGPARRRRVHRGAARQPRPPRHRGGAAVHRPGGLHGPDAAAARPRPGDAPDDRRRARTGWRSTGSRTTRGRRSTCTPRCAWSTTPGPPIGSDNFNRRSWTHDSELSAVVVDPSADDHSPYARRLRLTLAAEHLDREVDRPTPCSR